MAASKPMALLLALGAAMLIAGRRSNGPSKKESGPSCDWWMHSYKGYCINPTQGALFVGADAKFRFDIFKARVGEEEGVFQSELVYSTYDEALAAGERWVDARVSA